MGCLCTMATVIYKEFFNDKNSFIGAKSTTLEMTGVAFFPQSKNYKGI